MSLITINGNSFDPTAPIVIHLGLNKEDAKFIGYILLQTTGEPLRIAQKTELETKGVKIHEYVSEDAYLCGYKESHLDTLRNLPYIKYANIYLQQFVVQPTLKVVAGPSRNAVELSAIEITRTTRDVDIVFQDDVEISHDLLSNIANAVHADLDGLAITSNKKPKLETLNFT
jgi:serine protease AprX